jgi:hypothetical protein
MAARNDAEIKSDAKIELKSETKSETRSRTTLTRPAAPPEPVEPVEAHSQRKRPETGRFLLQVDRQTKGSYATLDAAMKAGTAIKKSYPIVQVGVYDAVDCVNSLIEAAGA